MPGQPRTRSLSKLWRQGAWLVLATALPNLAAAQSPPDNASRPTRKQIRACRVNPHAPRIDGELNEDIWSKAEFSGGFSQKQPNEGEPAQERTEIAFAYDDNAIYVAARMFSKNPNDIVSTMARRDNAGNSERIIISLDTYNNERTAYSFGVTASGVRTDYYHPTDEEYDRRYDFDPVWKAAAKRNALGWTAEMRIPFTQLRFNNTPEQVWGVNANRWAPTLNEDSYWVLVPKEETGWSSRMGDLVGIEGIKPSRRVELLPYVSSDATYSNVEADNPFVDGADYRGNFGGDVKMGVGPNLTLDATINPDFGQVEMDPAFVNLSAFEVTFDERRPFFLEGNELLRGGGADYYFSRRIGRSPRGWVDEDYVGIEPDYVDRPRSTTILGAAKLTGRLKSGLNVGVLGALTQKETAKAYNVDSGTTIEEPIEPAAGYGVVRLQQEFGSGSTAGVILTGAHNDLKSGTLLNDVLRRNAVTGGGDWNLRLRDGRYEVGGNVGFSYVDGSQTAIDETQRSSARFYQRPDADYIDYDPTRTSLTGWVARARVEKSAGKHWLWGTGVDAESPGFELNDLGIIRQSDDLYYWGNLRYRETQPGKIFHEWSLESWWNLLGNFGWVRNGSDVGMNFNGTYKNFMSSWIGADIWPRNMSDDLTRGGPLMQTERGFSSWVGLNSSPSGKLTWWGEVDYSWNEFDAESYWVGGNMTWRMGGRLELSLQPSYNNWRDARQYVDQIEGGNPLTYGDRYLFAGMKGTRLEAALRLNLALTPDLTLEFWGQPFAQSGEFFGFGELREARGQDLLVYGAEGTTIERIDDPDYDDGTYRVTDGADTFEFTRPDFNTISFRSNLVLRWEWSPGSTLFIVWQQNRADAITQNGIAGSGVNGRDWLDALGAEGDNVFAVKLTYWIPLF